MRPRSLDDPLHDGWWNEPARSDEIRDKGGGAHGCSKVQTIKVGGTSRPLRGYELRWVGPRDKGPRESGSFIDTVKPLASPEPPPAPQTSTLASAPSKATPVLSPPAARPLPTTALSETSPTQSLAGEIKELAALCAEGAISEAEFAQAKTRLLAGE